MPLTRELTPPAGESEERLSASLRQLEALTALAAAPSSGRDLEEICAGLADTITGLTDYRSCLVLLLSDEAPYHPRVLSRSSDIPEEYAARISSGSYPSERVESLVERGLRIEAGELGFAAYFPPPHYHHLDAVFPDRYKSGAPRPPSPDGAPGAWHEGDELFVPLFTHERELVGLISLDDPRSGRAPDRTGLLPAVAFARQTAQLVARRRDSDRLAALARREALVNRLSHAVRASLNLPEVLRAATHGLGQALGASRVYLRPYDPERPEVSPVMYEYLAEGCETAGGVNLSYHGPVGRHVMETQQTLVIHDPDAFDGASPEMAAHVRAVAARHRAPSKVICPLVVQGRFRGALCIHQTDRVRRWAADEVALVESVAAQLATGIAQAELFEMVERAKRTWEVTFDAMSDGIFIFSNERRLMRVNRAGAALEAASPYELLGRSCCDILRAGRGEGCIVERAAGLRRSLTLEYTPERLGRPLLVTAEPVFEDSGQVGVVCTVRDLTELRRIEAVARERQSLLEHVLESARETICAVSPEGRILWINSAATAMNGYAKEQLIGMDFLDLIVEADREAAAARFRRTLAGEPQTVELRLVTRAGQVRHVLSDATPIRIDGRTTGVLSITRDVTEQKQERERAAQADKLRALGQLASGVAHDFNNSLAAILGRAQLLRRTTNDREVARNLEIIQTAAEDAAATVRRIRSFAHQSAGEEFRTVEVGALLRDAVEITRTRWENDARARGLSYDVRVEADCELHTRGNASELREVFVNLIVNAVEAMPGGGRLHIICRREGARLRLLFTDDGAGMSEEVRARIFEPFYTTKGAQGTGLGLFVSYGIVERHGGYIEVASGPGRGTTFVIDLPHACPEPRAPEAGGRAQAERAGSMNVLVVDDEPAVRETLAEMVEALGHRVTPADGGRAALARLAAHPFDVVFTDLSMPGMDGWELAGEVRRLSPPTRICIVTGYGKDTPRPARGDDPADIVIGKPFDLRQVEEVLAQFKS